MSIDHTGPHGICSCDNSRPNCTCPEFIFSNNLGWTCVCCDGSIPHGLDLIDVLGYAAIRNRITRAVARASSPLAGPRLSGGLAKGERGEP